MAVFNPAALSSSGAVLPPFQTLALHSFLDDPFRALRVEIRGGIREHVHVYPHRAGGRTEPLGRELYEFDYQGIYLTNDRTFRDAWPGTIGLHRGAWEQQIVGDLVVSTIGKIRARAIKWKITQSAEFQNGEMVSVLFREEDAVDLLSPTSVMTLNVTPLADRAIFIINLAKRLGVQRDFFDSLLALARQIQGLVAMAKLQLEVIANRATAMADMIRNFDELEKSLNDAKNWQLFVALRDLAIAADELARDSLAKFAPLVTYETEAEMGVLDVSVDIYGDTSRAMEIMRLNPIKNPFRIPAATTLSVYADLSAGGLLRAA